MIWQRMMDRLTGQTRPRRSDRSTAVRKKTTRRLRLESLQKRELLAGDLGAIGGTAFLDANGDGSYQPGSEVALANVTVNLYRDVNASGTVGSFDGSDPLVGTTPLTVGDGGLYVFRGLDGADADGVTTSGIYFLEIVEGGGGATDDAGNALANVSVFPIQTITLSDTDDDGAVQQNIDGFTADQPGLPSVLNSASSVELSSGTIAGVIGGERDVEHTWVSDPDGTISESDFSVVAGQAILENGLGVTATLKLQYDGLDADGGALDLDEIGLRAGGATGIDLSNGDANAGVVLSVNADIAGDDFVRLRIYTDAGSGSEAFVSLVVGLTDVFVPFTDFTTIPALTPADFTNVGAIEAELLQVNGAAEPIPAGLDFTLSVVESRISFVTPADIGATVPLILGGEVFVDNGAGTNQPQQNDGLKAITEGMFQAPAINPIAVELYATDPAVGTPTPIATTTVNPLGSGDIGSYLFTTLDGGGDIVPGTYFVVIPSAEFTDVGGPLFGFRGSDIDTPGNGGTDVTDDNIEDDNDGVFVAGVGFVSGPITLAIGAEPSGGGNENNTVDFGVLPTTDLRIDKTLSGTSNVIAGGTAVFTVTVNNLGASEATDVSVSDVIPAGLTFVNVLDSSSTPVTTISSTEGGRPVRTFDVGTLAAGASVTFTVNMTIDGNIAIDPTNEIRVTGYEVEVDADSNDADRLPTDPLDGALENNIALELVDVPLAELTITKTDNIDAPATVTAGDNLTYTITASNIGGDTATNVIALDTLPTGVTFVAASGNFTTGDGTVELVTGGADDGRVRITFGSLAAGVTEVVTFDVLVNPAFGDADSPLNNSITVDADNAPPVTATDATPVVREVDVTVAKTVISTRTPDDRTDNNLAGDIIDNTAPFDVFAGGFVTYQIIATNAGPSEARGVTVTDTLGSGLSLVAGSFDALTSGATLGTVAGQSITFNVPNLAPGESRTFTFEAAVASNQFNPVDNGVEIATTDTEPTGHAVNTATVQIDPAPRVDLILNKTSNIATVVPGQDTVIYTFTVTHDTDSISDAVNVDVTDIIPANLTGVTVNAPGASNTNFFNTGTRQVLVEYASIPVGETRIFTLTATVDTSATGTIINSASVTVPGVTELDTSNNTSAVTINTTPEFDIEIAKTVTGNSAVGPLDNVTFTMIVSHDTNDDGTEADDGQSPSFATGIVVTDVLPAGLTFLSATAAGSAVTPTSTTGGTIVFPSFNLAPGITRTLTITASVDDDASGALTNNVSLVTAAGQTQTDNDSATASVTVTPQADVFVTKTVSETTARPGAELTYTVVVTNDGPSPAAGVSVVDTLPTGVTFVSGTGPNGVLVAVGGVVTVTPAGNAPLAAGGSFQFTLTARVNDAATTSQTNTVTVSTSTQEIANDQSNTAAVTTAIDQAINELSGTIFRDFNDDGDQNNGMDSGLAGIELLLTGGDLGAGSRRTTTDENGFYEFDELVAGDYQVQRLGLPNFFNDGKEQAGVGATPADSGDTIDVTVGSSELVAPENNFALVPHIGYWLCIQ